MQTISTVRVLPIAASAVSVPGWEGRLRWAAPRLPGLALAAFALPLLLVCGAGTLRWIGRPFPGFFVMANGIVPTIGLFDWPGMQAGLPFHARIRSVDGRPVAGAAEVYAAVEALPVGTVVVYGVEKDGQQLDVRVPTTRFRLIDYWMTVGLFVTYGAIVLLSGVIVYLVRPRHPAAPAYLLQTASMGLFALTGPVLYDPAQWWLSPLHFVAQALFPAALVHVGCTFPVPRRFVGERRWWLAIPYVIGLAVACWILAAFYAEPPSTRPLHAAYANSAFGTIACGALLLWALREPHPPRVRRQLHAVLPAIVLGLVVAGYGFFNTARGGGDFPINLIALTAFIAYVAVGWAIARHDLFDIDGVLRQTLVYVALTAAISVVYGGAVAVTMLLDPEILAGHPRVFHVGFVVLVAALFEPARARMQRVVDRVFWRDRVDYRLTVQEVSAALATLRDLDEILDRVGRTLCRGLQVRSFLTVLWDDAETRVWTWSQARSCMEETPGQSFDELRRFLPSRTNGSPCVVRLQAEVDPALFVPLTVAGQLIGAFGLGRRRSGRGFSKEDTALLGTLAAQSAIALENARSYRGLQRFAGELEEKVRRRTAELQASNHELAAAYRELTLAQAQLVHSEKMASLGLLVSGVAHEINNPVSFIVGNVEPLRETLGQLAARSKALGDADIEQTVAQVRRAFEVIARGAERTAGIVNDLRTFSRLGEAQARPVDVQEGLEVCLRLLRPRWADRITIHRTYHELPLVDAVPGQLNQVFMNVLANACDAIPGRGNVWIATALEGPDVLVSVRDDGVGIPSTQLDRIFDPFFTTKAQGKGTGLGLAISHGIITQHGGAIAVVSTPGQGASFTLRLPRRARCADRT